MIAIIVMDIVIVIIIIILQIRVFKFPNTVPLDAQKGKNFG